MGKAEIGCGFEATGIGNVGNDDGNFDAWETAFPNGIGDGQEVGAASGEKDSQAD
jgi:hypothetical protein